MNIEDKYDGTIQTFTGKMFNPINPVIEDIDIMDIAHALSLSNRYVGHTTRPYSVAEHSLNLVNYAEQQNAHEDLKKWCLMHDASEAYLCDIPRPIKKFLPQYKEIENQLQKIIAERFDLCWPIPDKVLEWDTRILLNESVALMDDVTKYLVYKTHQPLENITVRNKYIGHNLIEMAFLGKCKELNIGNIIELDDTMTEYMKWAKTQINPQIFKQEYIGEF